MNHKDIDGLFNQQVAELIRQGYTIHTSTMSGSQGEIAKVDLSKGNELLRVLLTRTTDWDVTYSDIISIQVGRANTSAYNSLGRTIWNNSLEILSEIKLAKISDTFYTTLEEGKLISELRCQRRRWRRSKEIENLGDAHKSIALKFLQKQPRMKTCTLSDIESMTRVRTRQGRASYQIKAKGKIFTLGA